MIGNQEYDVEFYFMKTCAAFNALNHDNEIESIKMAQTASPIELVANPSVVKIGSNVQGLLNITAKFKNSFIIDQENFKDKKLLKKINKKQFFSHLLIAKIKDTPLMFSFIVKISLVD